MVVEVPPGQLIGAVDDAFFRHITDLGATGPNRGAGGKWLFAGPDFSGSVPEGLQLIRTPTYRN
jgi:hypothetical protein